MIEWSKYLYYDETSKSCLRWKDSRRSGKNFHIEHVLKDSEAGNLVFDTDNNPLYIDINLNGKLYKAGSVVWSLFNDKLPQDKIVDHINGNPHDNKIVNLRAISRAENSRNRKKPITNTSGKVGVHWLTNRSGKFAMVRWCDHPSGVRRSKSFSVKKYGELTAFKMACDYRDKMIMTLNVQGANYTERHGL